MIDLVHQVAGQACNIRFVESEAEAKSFLDWISRTPLVAFDTETTGLDIYSPGNCLRLAQFGSPSEAWVLPVARFAPFVVDGLRWASMLVMHNASFDLQVADFHLGVTIEELSRKTFDTRILAHLLDPRSKSEGGTGHGLKNLADVYVDEDAHDGEAELVEVFRQEYSATKATGWSLIDIDHPTYIRYAGLDVLLTARLFDQLMPFVRDLGLDPLSRFEHHLQGILATVQRKGVRIDVPYTERLSVDLSAESIAHRSLASAHGVENVNSNAQVAEALLAMGEQLHEFTAGGSPKVDKTVLLPLADLDSNWLRLGVREPNVLAEAVLRSKRAEKWDETYARQFLKLRDSRDRLHPMINSLQARTARMSISGPPLQQLPSGDSRVRSALLADVGEVIVSIDYSQIEVRVAAALSKDENLIAALLSGEDLHSTTARHIFGDGFTAKQRKIGKMVTFARLYGSGAQNIARQAGIDVGTAKQAVAGFDRAYSGLARYGKGLQRAAEFGKREVVSPSGRHLPLDRDRTYAALNAIVQSTARDILAQAIVSLHGKRMTGGLLLPIHDELLFSLPSSGVDDAAKAIAEVMEGDFFGVPLLCDVEIGSSSWGSLYE